jgi:hypothetical protein
MQASHRAAKAPNPGADVVMLTEGNTRLNANRKIKLDPASSKTLACIDVLHAGTGRSPRRPQAAKFEASKGR